MTLIVNLPGSVSGSLVFPTISKFGLGLDVDAVAYLDKVSTAETTITETRANAIDAFVKALKTAGAWSSIIEIVPFFGDNVASARIPLRAALTDGALLVHPNTDPTDRYSIVGGQVVGLLGSGTDNSKNVESALTVGHLYDKSAAFSNQSANRAGFTVVSKNLAAFAGFRIGAYGRHTGGGDLLHMLRTEAADVITARVFGSNPIINSFRTQFDGLPLYSSYGFNGTHTHRLFGSLSSATHSQAAASNDIVPTAFTKSLRHGLNCQTTTTNDSAATRTSGAATEMLMFWMVNDGSIGDEATQIAVRNAVNALLTALGKVA